MTKPRGMMYAVYSMIRTQLYFPEDLYLQLRAYAKRQRKSLAEIVRSFVQRGIRQEKRGNPAEVFLKIARLAGTGPRDLSEKHDEYLYGKKSPKYGR